MNDINIALRIGSNRLVKKQNDMLFVDKYNKIFIKHIIFYFLCYRNFYNVVALFIWNDYKFKYNKS